MSKLKQKTSEPTQLCSAIGFDRFRFNSEMLIPVEKLEDQDLLRDEIVEECSRFLCWLGLQRYGLGPQKVMHAMMEAFVEACRTDWPPEIVCGDQGLKLGWLPNRMKMPIEVMHEWHPEASCDREALEIAKAVRRHLHGQLCYQHKPMGWTDTAFDAGQEDHNDQ